jgi:hypothetical protein
MSQAILELKLKLQKVWLKLLKAEVKHKANKVEKWEKKVIELELIMAKLNK